VVIENRYVKGEELRYRLTSTAEGKVTMAGIEGQKPVAEIPTKMEMELAYRMAVKETDAQGNADIETVFEKFNMLMESGGMKMRMEADDKGARLFQGDTVVKDAPGLEDLKRLFKNPTAMKMDKRGKLISMNEPGGVGGLFPHMDLYGFLKGNQAVLPEGPVAVGQSWNEKRSASLGENTGIKLPEGKEPRIDIRYTLAALVNRGGRHCAEIKVKGTMDVKNLEIGLPQGGGAGPGGKAVFERLRQNMTGTIYFDLQKGCAVGAHTDSESEQHMSRTVKTQDEGKEVTFTTATTMTMASELKLVE
jgi:hypothetical protein